MRDALDPAHVATTGGAAAIELRDELLAYPNVPSRWRDADCLALPAAVAV